MKNSKSNIKKHCETKREKSGFDAFTNNLLFFLDLMNDWELAGNKNSWVCPSDRHLALRAQ